MGLVNQVALITGATSGIGRAYTKYLLQNGVKVALCDINFEYCQSIADEFSRVFGVENVLPLCCNVIDEEQFENAFVSCLSHFKRLDIVINNAGVCNESMTNWDTTMNINYGGVVGGTKLAIKYMGAPCGGKGGIVVQTAFVTDSGVAPVYRSSKRAVVEYTRKFGGESKYKYLKIRIMALCPSLMSTSSSAAVAQDEISRQRLNVFQDLSREAVMRKRPIGKKYVDNVGKALIYILERGKTGECWTVENDEEPPKLVEVPDSIMAF